MFDNYLTNLWFLKELNDYMLPIATDTQPLSINYMTNLTNTQFLKEVTNIKDPIWATPNEIIYSRPAFHLRKFSSGDKIVLVCPPNAGHRSCIADYKKDQSLVEHYIRKGYEVYCVEWRSCSYLRKDESIADLVQQVRECIDFVGKEVHLVGLCQAGWLAAMFTTQYPEGVASLTIGGAPIDFDAPDLSEQDGYIKRLVHSTPQLFFEWLVMLGGGIMRGSFILAGFKNMHWWDRYVGDYSKLWAALDIAPANPTDINRLRHFRNWYESTQNLAGKWYLEAVDALFRKNKLITGELGYNLSRITCPVKMIAGENDDITPPPQVFNMGNYISSSAMEKILVPRRGHLGLFMAKDALPYYE